jgi:hypothetical protein
LEEGVDDTEMTARSEAYQTALVFCQPVKMAAAQDIPGAKTVYGGALCPDASALG